MTAKKKIERGTEAAPEPKCLVCQSCVSAGTMGLSVCMEERSDHYGHVFIPYKHPVCEYLVSIKEKNPVIAFIDEKCEVGEGYQITPRALYIIYEKWCEDSKIKLLPFKKFLEQIFSNLKLKRIKPTGEIESIIVGVGLKVTGSDVP